MTERWIIDRETQLVLGRATGRNVRMPRLSRLSYLMGLYAENYQKLRDWIDVRGMPAGVIWSILPEGLPVRLEITEQHAFTTELRLSYELRDPHTGQLDPSAFVRVYHDTRQTEVTHCYVGRNWQDAIGMTPPSEMLYAHRLQMNVFLGKWLDFLLSQGHGSVSEWSSVAPCKNLETKA